MGFITNRIKVYKARIIIIKKKNLNVYKVNPKIETFGVRNLLLSETLIRRMDQKLFILIWYYRVVKFRGLKSKLMYLYYNPIKSHAKHVIICSLIKYCRSNFKHTFFKERKMWLWLWSSHHLWTRQLAGSMYRVMLESTIYLFFIICVVTYNWCNIDFRIKFSFKQIWHYHFQFIIWRFIKLSICII